MQPNDTKEITDPVYVDAHHRSIDHKNEIQRSACCGCFYCQEIFAPSTIVEWIDEGETALCPRCGIDAVLGSELGFPIEPTFLQMMHRTWFRPTSPLSLGAVAFSGSRFVFWATLPALVIFGLMVPITVAMRGEATITSVLACIVWLSTCVFAALAIFDARRFPWAARTVTGLICFVYLSYLIFEIFFDSSGSVAGNRSMGNSLRGFIVIGLPALGYTLLGRFSRVETLHELQRQVEKGRQ